MNKLILSVFISIFFIIGITAQDTIFPYSSIQIQAHITQPDNNYFGFSIATDSDYMVVGAPGYNSWQGCVYVYHFENGKWTLKTILHASDAVAMDAFGQKVAIRGSTIAVGAYGKDIFTGTAYIFEQKNDSTWEQVQIIKDPRGKHRDYFGSAIALTDKYLAIGAWGDDTKATNAGAVYLYEKTGGKWQLTKKIYASDAAYRDKFGFSLDMNEQILAVGAYSNDDKDVSSGTVYLFDLTDLKVIKVLRAHDAGKYWEFGRSISIDNNAIAIGAIGADNFIGAAYIFGKQEGQPWDSVKEITKISPFDSIPDAEFGYSIALSNNKLVVGAPLSSDTGFVYIYEDSSTWQTYHLVSKLTSTSARSKDFYGHAVTISSGDIIIGAYRKDDSKLGNNCGAVYILDKNNFTQTQELFPVEYTKNEFDYFGYAIDVYENYAIIGAPGERNSIGAAYLFHFNGQNWERLAKFTNTYPYTSKFGQSVAIYKDAILIGAPYYETKRGAAFLFTRPPQGWHDMNINEAIKLTAPERHYFDYFGYSVDIDSGNIVIGSYGYDNYAGKAFVFVPNTSWANGVKLLKIIRPANTKSDDYFGYNVLLHDSLILIGAPKTDGTTYNQGAVYLFNKEQNDTIEILKIQPTTLSKNSYFGNSVDIDGPHLAIGAYKEPSGSVYLITLDTGNLSIDTIIRLHERGLNYNAEFGKVVKIFEQKLFVALDRWNDKNFLEKGQVRIFDLENLNLKAIFDVPEGQNFLNLAWSIAPYNKGMLVGAIGKNYNNGYSVGQIYDYNTKVIIKPLTNNTNLCIGDTLKIIALNPWKQKYKWFLKLRNGLITEPDNSDTQGDTLVLIYSGSLDSALIITKIISDNILYPSDSILITGNSNPPIIECRTDTTIYTDGEFVINDSLFGVKKLISYCELDSLTNNLTISSSFNGYTLLPGQYHIIWLAKDVNGNQGKCSFDVNVLLNDVFRVYPNPASDILHILTPSVLVKIKIMDNTGRVIIKTQQSSQQADINIASLQPGVYIVVIEGKNFSAHYKIIKL